MAVFPRSPTTVAVLIMNGVQLTGNKWEKIAKALPGRSASAVRNRYHRLSDHKGMDRADGMAISTPASASTQAWVDTRAAATAIALAVGDAASASTPVTVIASVAGDAAENCVATETYPGEHARGNEEPGSMGTSNAITLTAEAAIAEP